MNASNENKTKSRRPNQWTWIDIDGVTYAFKFHRDTGLTVRHGDTFERTISFQRLVDVAEEQMRFSLV